jgi:biopolymer transport protein ExbD
MSHGPSSEGGSCEPNLTPLLDVVLQLLMFFMMCVNFVNEQVNVDIKLPKSQAVKPMDKTDPDVLFVNVKPFAVSDFQDRLPSDVLARVQAKFNEGDECIIVVGKEPMKPEDLRVWLRQQFEDAEKLHGGKDVNTAIVIRGDLKADYGQVFGILKMCKVAGYRRLMLRAITKHTPGGST